MDTKKEMRELINLMEGAYRYADPGMDADAYYSDREGDDRHWVALKDDGALDIHEFIDKVGDYVAEKVAGSLKARHNYITKLIKEEGANSDITPEALKDVDRLKAEVKETFLFNGLSVHEVKGAENEETALLDWEENASSVEHCAEVWIDTVVNAPGESLWPSNFNFRQFDFYAAHP